MGFFFQAEDGIRDLVRSRGLGDVYKRQKRGFVLLPRRWVVERSFAWMTRFRRLVRDYERLAVSYTHLTLPTIYSV